MTNYERRKLKSQRKLKSDGRAAGPKLWNVWDCGQLLGVVNEAGAGWALDSAYRAWPGHPLIRVVEATLDPFRVRTLVRPEFLLPLITSETIH